VINEHLVVVVDASGVEKQFLQVADVLLDDLGHLLKLRELVSVVVLKHALGADKLVADAAEVLNLLVLVLKAKDTRHVSHLRLC
jgi:hypothetical protein